MAVSIPLCLPKSKSDKFAFFCFLLVIHSVGIFELVCVLPSIYSTADHATTTGFSLYYFHVIMGWFIYFNVMVNLYKILTINTSTRGRMLPSVLRPGWRFCYACETNSPPRSFHCLICGTCILKRDHHCTFTGNCIGLYNQRYYIGLILYMFLAAGYSCALNLDFIHHILGKLSFTSLLTILFPMISWIFTQTDALSSFQVIMTSLCLVGFLLTGGLLVYHLLNGINGQVVHERTHNIHTYNLGWKENLGLLLGARWKIAWLCPLIDSPVPSDGFEYITREQYSSFKTL